MEWSNYTHSCVQRVTLPNQVPKAKETVTAGRGRHDVRRQSVDLPRRLGPVQLAVQRGSQCRDRRADDADDHLHVPCDRRVLNRRGGVQRERALVGNRRDGGPGKDGIQRAFTVSQGPGTMVSFDALTTLSGKPVINYLWEFGDGASRSGSSIHPRLREAGRLHGEGGAVQWHRIRLPGRRRCTGLRAEDRGRRGLPLDAPDDRRLTPGLWRRHALRRQSPVAISSGRPGSRPRRGRRGGAALHVALEVLRAVLAGEVDVALRTPS